MMNDYVAGLHDQEEPEQIDCSSGIVPAGSIVEETGECKEEQEILVPVLTSMTSFFFKHYRLIMYSYLNRCLKNGTLDGTVGFHVLNKAIDRHVCSFGNPQYWRVDRETFIVNVPVALILKTGTEDRKWDGFLSLWFHMGENVSCSVEYLAPLDEMTDDDLPLLSSYLAPIFTNKQMDAEAEAIWAIYLPEALHDPEKRCAAALANKMGLSIEYHPVYKHKNTSSILFFEEGELIEWDEHAETASETEPKTVTIPAKTIVINTNAVQRQYSGFNIYHECVHYEEHYLFYRLQKMGNNDP